MLAAGSGPSAYWYLTRSTGAVAMVLLTLTVALGVIDVRRYATTRWPRFLIDRLHRNLALLTIAESGPAEYTGSGRRWGRGGSDDVLIRVGGWKPSCS